MNAAAWSVNASRTWAFFENSLSCAGVNEGSEPDEANHEVADDVERLGTAIGYASWFSSNLAMRASVSRKDATHERPSRFA